MIGRIAALSLAVISSQAIAATGFTYQGQLISNGTPASGGFDFQFTLHTALTAGTAVGTPVTASNVTVTGGLFATTLDFGAAAFDGADRWVEISVRPAGSSTFTALSPRQAITPTPYALTAINNVLRAGDTMTGKLNLPAGGLAVGTSQVSVLPSGYVGIGTATPTFALDIQGTGFTGVNLHDTASPYSFSQSVNGNDWYFSVSEVGGGSTLMHYNGTRTMLSQFATVSAEFGIKVRYVRVTNNVTLDDLQHVILVDSTNAAVTVTLHAASAMQGRVQTFKHIAGTNAVTIIGPALTETIDGVGSISLTAANATRTILCDGTKWFVIGN